MDYRKYFTCTEWEYLNDENNLNFSNYTTNSNASLNIRFQNNDLLPVERSSNEYAKENDVCWRESEAVPEANQVISDIVNLMKYDDIAGNSESNIFLKPMTENSILGNESRYSYYSSNAVLPVNSFPRFTSEAEAYQQTEHLISKDICWNNENNQEPNQLYLYDNTLSKDCNENGASSSYKQSRAVIMKAKLCTNNNKEQKPNEVSVCDNARLASLKENVEILGSNSFITQRADNVNFEHDSSIAGYPSNSIFSTSYFRRSISHCLGEATLNKQTGENEEALSSQTNKSVHSVDAAEFRCFMCKYIGKNLKELHTHVTKIHVTGSPKFQCDYCDYQSKHRSNLYVHIKLKHDENAPIFKCKNCVYETKLKYDLKRHIELRHVESSPKFQCDYCDYQYKRRCGLNDHIKLKHNENPPIFECKHCVYKTKRKGDLKKHVKSQHDKSSQIFEI